MEIKKKHSLVHGAGSLLMFVTGINLLRNSLRMCLGFHNYLYDKMIRGVRPEVKYPNDTFPAACKRHGVQEKQLKTIIKALRQRRALFQFCLLVCTVAVGVSLYNIRGLALIMSVLAWLSSFLFLLQNTLRLWQCENKKLGSVDDFLADGGFSLMLQIGRGPAAAASIVALVFICSLSTSAMANGDTASMGLYTKAADGDPSLTMLAKIVGGVAGVFPGEDTALTETFMVFNTAVLAVSLLFLLWNFGAGVVQTAHEGEFLGKRFSSIWMPIRNVVGVGGLVPVFGGWSACQIVMLWATTIGIGLANLVWQTGYTAVLENISSPIITPQAAINDSAIKSIIKAQVCMIGFNEELNNGSSPGWGAGQDTKLFKNDPRFKQHEQVLTGVVNYGNGKKTATGVKMSWGGQGKGDYPVDICGGVVIPPERINEAAKKARFSSSYISVTDAAKPVVDRQTIINAAAIALQNMAKSLLPISTGIVHGKFPEPQVFVDIKMQYLEDLGKAIGEEVLKANSEFAEYMRDGGKSWLNAGTIFQKIAAVNTEIQRASTVQISPIGTDKIDTSPSRGINVYSGAKQAMRSYDSWMAKYSATVGAQGSAGGGLEGSGEFSLKDPDLGLLYGPFHSQVVSLVLSGITNSETNLFSGLINTGNLILIHAPIAYGTVQVVIGGAQMVLGGSAVGFGLGNPTAPAGSFSAIALYMFIALALAGLTLAVYLPFLPMIIWYGGILAWMICVLEAVIAAPLWMFTHMEADGEGMGNKSAHGYLFLLNVLFRPALMIMALIAAWLMLEVFGVFLRESLSILFGSSAGNFTGLASLFTFFGVLFVFVSLAIMTVNKCFGLVDILPNQVFAWVGGHYNGVGGGEADRESKQAFVGAVSNQRGQAQIAGRGGRDARTGAADAAAAEAAAVPKGSPL